MNVQDYKLANRYATAFLNVYYSQLVEDDKKSLMESIAFAQKRRRVLQLLRCTSFNKQIPAVVIKSLPLSVVMKNYCLSMSDTLIRNRRMDLFLYILQNMLIEWDKRDTIFRFTITSSSSLQLSQKKIIEKFLHKQIQGVALCIYQEDASLIAGITIQGATYAWSNALKDRLKEIEYSIIRKGIS